MAKDIDFILPVNSKTIVKLLEKIPASGGGFAK
jgi:hypothetical protein